MIKSKIIALFLLIVCSFTFVSCGELNNKVINENTPIEDQSEITEREKEPEENNKDDDNEQEDEKQMSQIDILQQKSFENGFFISYMNEKNWINYNDLVDVSRTKWGINEEGSNDLINADTIYTNENGYKVFKSPSLSKILKINNTTGAFYMELNASVDYGDHKRESGEAWPHLLFTQNYQVGEVPTLDNMNNLNMKLDFSFLKFEDKTNGNKSDNLHACQFQWYVAIRNVNESSPDYNDWFWLGLQFFDNRYMWASKNLIVDEGKDTATGKAIYTIDMKEVMNRRVVEVGESYNVDYDILPNVIEALNEVKAFTGIKTLRNTSLSDLQIIHTNIGWEMPGSYDAGIMVDSMSLLYELKK